MENLSRQVQELHEQNVSLKTEIEHASTTTVSAGDKSFMDGAAWFGRSSVMVADKMGEKVEDALRSLQDIAEKVGEGDDDDDDDDDGSNAAARAIRAQVLDTVSEVEECVTEGRVRIRKLFEGMLDASKDFGAGVGSASDGRGSTSDAMYGDTSDTDVHASAETKVRPSSSVASALGLAYKSAATAASKFGGGSSAKAEYTSDSSFFDN